MLITTQRLPLSFGDVQWDLDTEVSTVDTAVGLSGPSVRLFEEPCEIFYWNVRKRLANWCLFVS